MSTRATQSPDYWGSRFTLSGDDRELLLNLFVEDEQPRSSDELAQAIIRHRVEREEYAIRRKRQAQGTLYQPKRAFQVDEQVVFPALDFARRLFRSPVCPNRFDPTYPVAPVRRRHCAG